MFTANSTKMCRDGECRGSCLHEISNPNKFCIGRTKKDKCSWGGRYLKYRPPPFYIGIEKLTIQMSIKNSKKNYRDGQRSSACVQNFLLPTKICRGRTKRRNFHGGGRYFPGVSVPAPVGSNTVHPCVSVPAPAGSNHTSRIDISTRRCETLCTRSPVKLLALDRDVAAP